MCLEFQSVNLTQWQFWLYSMWLVNSYQIYMNPSSGWTYMHDEIIKTWIGNVCYVNVYTNTQLWCVNC